MILKKILTGGLSLSLALTSTMPIVHAKHIGPVEVSITDQEISIGNDYMTRTYTKDGDHILTSKIANKRTNTDLIPQAGSQDFIINLISNENAGNPTPEIVNKQEYVYNGTDSKLDSTNWQASLTNANGNAFANNEVMKLFDGNLANNVDNYQISGYPMTLEIDLKTSQSISSVSVNKRPGYSDELYGINGTMGGYEIWVNPTDEDTTWTKVTEGEFTADDYNLHQEGTLYNVGDMVFVNFDQPVDAKHVKVIQTSAAFGNAQEFTSSEIGLYATPLEKVLKVVEPTQALDRAPWAISIKNKDNTTFDETQVKYLIDGKLDTYTNQWDKTGNPITVDIDLGSKQNVSSFSIDKRPGYGDELYGINGTMGEYQVYVSDDQINWEIAGAGNFTQDAYQLHEENGLFNVGNRVYANLLKTYQTRYLRIVQTSCSLGSTEEFTSAELNLYADAYQGYDWTTEIPGKSSSTQIKSSELKFVDAKEETTSNNGKKVTITYEDIVKAGVTYSIDQVIVLEQEDHYMHSFLEIRASDLDKAQIDYIDQDRFVLPEDAQGVWSHPDDSKISSMWIGKHELMLGQPIYVNGFFMGSEFPATDTIIKENETQVRYYSGKTFRKMAEDGQLTTDGKFVSWQNVVGAATGTSEAVVQTDFFDYIEDIATPTEFRKQYNSWYDNMMSITDESIANSFNGAEAGLAAQGVEPLDAYVVDDGWNNYYDGTFTGPSTDAGSGTVNQTGFWEFNHKFPNELYTSSALSDKFQSNFGLWVGPQGGYNYFGTFAKYLESVGTGYVQPNSALGNVVCTGSHKYLKNFTDRFIDYQTRFNIDYWKWDGFASRPCNDASHDHMVGGDNNMYFTSDMWEGWINVFEDVREARAKEGKGLWINATCYINLSPWLLQWVNTIWVQDSGDTGELGTGERHEQKITYRDQVYYQLYKQNQIQFPMKNIYNHDPIYGVSDKSNATTEVFREYLMANAVRGTAFWELYYSPSILDEAKWQVTADVLDFAQSNHDILKNAKLFGYKPSEGVYGYSSWNQTEGIVSFTNPLDEEQTYQLTIDSEVGAINALNNASVIQIEPYAVGTLDKEVSYGDEFSVTLAPHETKIFMFNRSNTTKPNITNVKNIENNVIRISFDQRVSDQAEFTLANNRVISAVLMDDYRTYEITTEKPVTTSEATDVELQVQNLTNIYGIAFADDIMLHAYQDGVIATATGTKIDPTTGNYYTEINEATTLNNNGIKGSDEFGIRFMINTTAQNQTVLQQGNDINISIDAEGYLVANIKSQTITSKETVTTVTEKAHGIFQTNAYVPTATKEHFEGIVNDGKPHAIVITREANGMLKLYENGTLRDSAYINGEKEMIQNAPMVLGSQGLNAQMADVQVVNQAFTYLDAQNDASNITQGTQTRALDRSLWKAEACSEMPAGTGDSNAQSAIDGDLGTWWHTNYVGGDNHQEKHWISFDFGKEETFKTFELTGRGGANGDPTKYNLYAKINGEWKAIVTEGVFDASKAVNSITFANAIKASGLKLEYLESVNGFAAAKEINLYAEAMTLQHDVIATTLEAMPKETKDGFTEQSYAAYEKAYQKLVDLAEATKGADTTDFILQDILDEITKLKADLIDTKELTKTIETVKLECSKSDLYLSSSIEDAKTLIAEAETLFNSGTKEEVAAMITKLNEFQFIMGSDATSLKALIHDIEALKQSEYTQASIAALNQLLPNAKQIANQPSDAALIQKTMDELRTQKDALVSLLPLQEAMASFQALMLDPQYTPASIEKAKATYATLDLESVKIDGTKEEVADLVQAIQAITLDKKGNKALLEAAIQHAQEKIASEDYTEASKKVLAKEIEAVSSILKDENALQHEVEEAIDQLRNVNLVSIKALNEAIQKFEVKLQSNALTQTSYDEATTLLESAKALRNAGSESAISTMVETLSSFSFTFVGDKETLQNTINANASFSQNEYTQASWQLYQAAFQHAQSVFADKNATEADVQAAISGLLDAVANLQKVSVEENNGTSTGDETNTGLMFGGLLFGGVSLLSLCAWKKKQEEQ